MNNDITNSTITDAKLATITTTGKVANSATTADVNPSNNSEWRNIAFHRYAEGVPSLSPGLARGTSAYPGKPSIAFQL